MALEEEFNISVSENGAESISTVQDAADLIQRAVSENPWGLGIVTKSWYHIHKKYIAKW